MLQFTYDPIYSRGNTSIAILDNDAKTPPAKVALLPFAKGLVPSYKPPPQLLESFLTNLQTWAMQEVYQKSPKISPIKDHLELI